MQNVLCIYVLDYDENYNDLIKYIEFLMEVNIITVSILNFIQQNNFTFLRHKTIIMFIKNILYKMYIQAD